MAELYQQAEKNSLHLKSTEKEPLFSIIVPAYNVVEYIDECIESILDNSLEDYEIVLVDDGSSDGTSRLVDKWMRRDTRVKAIHQENGGLSAARNSGLAVAQGKYVVFVDADDCLAPWALADLVAIIHEASEPDVIITEMSNVQDVLQLPSRIASICIASSCIRKDNAFAYMFTEKKHVWPAQQYPVKRSLIEKFGLAFVYGILHEDVCWTAEVMASAENFATYSHPWYIRRLGRDGSIMSSASIRHITDTVQAVKMALGSPVFSMLTESQATLLRNRLAISLFPPLKQYGRLNPEDKEKAAACIAKNLSLFSISRKPVHRLFIATCKAFGAKRALRLISSIGKQG